MKNKDLTSSLFALQGWLVIAKFGGGSDSKSGSGCSDSDGSTETAAGLGAGLSEVSKSGGEVEMVDGDATAAVDMPDDTDQIEVVEISRLVPSMGLGTQPSCTK